MNKYQLVQETIQKYFEAHILKPAGLEKSQAQSIALKLSVSTAIVYVVYHFFIYRLYFHPLNKIPGPKVGWFPLMGNFGELISAENTGDVERKWTKRYGGIYTYHGPWNEPSVMVSDHVLLKQILTTQEYDFIKPPQASKFLRRVLGNGLLVAEGEAHRKQRKMLNPAFSVNAIRNMVPLMALPGRHLRDKWMKKIIQGEKVGDKEDLTEVEVSSGLSMAALDVIGWTFGQDFKSLESAGSTSSQSRLSQAYLHLLSGKLTTMKILTFLFPILRFLPTKHNIEEYQNLKWLNRESKKLVQAGIDRAAKEKELPSTKQNKTKDLLATMVDLIDEETGQGFTAEELRNQCLTFLAAGHETTSVSLSWCLWLLAKNQEIQDKLRAEVRALFRDKDNETPSYEEINNLPLLNNVVRETFRLIPAVPFTTRLSCVDVVLDKYFIPKNTCISIPPIVNHLSPEIWGEDAEEFNPYRWEQTEKIGNTYQYMPFLAGGRMCIGYKFALVEIKVLLAILVQNLQYFEKANFKITKRQDITMKPLPNMTLWLKTV